jgi:LAO/AO transport system kinase
MEDEMPELSDKIKKSLGDDGKITCGDALRIAAEAGVSPGAVGKEINRLEIKIKGCQLGCF